MAQKGILCLLSDGAFLWGGGGGVEESEWGVTALFQMPNSSLLKALFLLHGPGPRNQFSLAGTMGSGLGGTSQTQAQESTVAPDWLCDPRQWLIFIYKMGIIIPISLFYWEHTEVLKTNGIMMLIIILDGPRKNWSSSLNRFMSQCSVYKCSSNCDMRFSNPLLLTTCHASLITPELLYIL